VREVTEVKEVREMRERAVARVAGKRGFGCQASGMRRDEGPGCRDKKK